MAMHSYTAVHRWIRSLVGVLDSPRMAPRPGGLTRSYAQMPGAVVLCTEIQVAHLLNAKSA
jgi:hypothetical protein